MQFSNRFTLAVHILVCIDTFSKDNKITSEYLANSTGVNGVTVRNILGQLKAAGLVEIARGTGGALLTRSSAEITLLDIFNAVEKIENDELFHFHESPSTECPVGRNIHLMLDPKLEAIHSSFVKELRDCSLADIKANASRRLANRYGLRLHNPSAE